MTTARVPWGALLAWLVVACGGPASGRGGAPGGVTSSASGTATTLPHAQPAAPVGSSPAPSGGPVVELAALRAALPAGWQIAEPSDAEAQAVAALRGRSFALRKLGTECLIRFGANRGQTRREVLQRRLHVYGAADMPAVRASEDRYRELSSHCPLDAELTHTGALFVAASPCHRTLSDDDPGCRQAAAELDEALIRFFAAQKP